ncbi:regulatory sensor-transducer, blar1/mecr1 family / tonb family protein [hydrocarbon metagenome]|uniref:Regulatory sensor-transducer, blar1/mecr1 family / tonb family protein n=1 Tax=hydrocarbon metagenome TaxID=938273 RepID=A0A0W8FYG4_9ZZZZ
MKNLIKSFLVIALLCSTMTFAQAKEVPMPVGGIKALMENVKYPEKAHDARLEGKLLLEVTIDESGNVVKSVVMESAGVDFDNAAIAAVKKTKFAPAEKGGKKVKASVVIPFQFKLGSGTNK